MAYSSHGIKQNGKKLHHGRRCWYSWSQLVDYFLIVATPVIYLASRSPRRRELLNQIGISHALIDVEIDETPLPRETADDFVLRMAQEKARAGAASIPLCDLPVLAADTDVVVDDRILGKPVDEQDAVDMLQLLSGREHRVLSAVALVWKGERSMLCESLVRFRPLNDAEIRAYWHSGEPADKAGGYGIQGLGAMFIERIKGSYSGVMGLPLYETATLFRDAGFQLLE